MPKLDGREALASIKADASLRNIPVVVLSTSSLPRDIDDSYDLGASSFITKPVTFGELESLVKNLMRYWFETVALPVPAGAAP